MISRLFRGLVVALLLAAPVPGVAAPVPATATQSPPQPQPALHPALWKIIRNGTTIWLFGTIHMLPTGANWLIGPVARAVDSADEIATEIYDPSGSAARAAIAARAPLPPGEHLSTLIDPRERARLTQRLAQFGLAPDRFDADKPWFAAVALSSLPLLRRGFNASNGVEAILNARAQGRTVVRTGIETADGQLAILDTLPQASQIAYLTGVIDDFGSIDATIDAMIAAWGKGDADALAQLMKQDEGKDDPILIERLLLNRNRGFAAWIAARLARPGTVFMAIGAGHLAGDGSVQADLARMGITATRVQ